jgi:hypothetical protein
VSQNVGTYNSETGESPKRKKYKNNSIVMILKDPSGKRNLEASTSWKLQGLSRPVQGLLYLYYLW